MLFLSHKGQPYFCTSFSSLWLIAVTVIYMPHCSVTEIHTLSSVQLGSPKMWHGVRCCRWQLQTALPSPLNFCRALEFGDLTKSSTGILDEIELCYWSFHKDCHFKNIECFSKLWMHNLSFGLQTTSLNSGLQFSVFRVSVFVIKLIATYLIFLYSYAQLPVGILSIANKEKIQLIFIFTITPWTYPSKGIPSL